MTAVLAALAVFLIPTAVATADAEPKDPQGWADAIPWESLRMPHLDKPGAVAQALIAVTKWLSVQLVPIALVVAIGVTGAFLLALLSGVVSRQKAFLRIGRVLAALALILVVASGLAFTFATIFGNAVESSINPTVR